MPVSKHADAAYQLALQLDAMNQDRKQIEEDMRQQAFESLEELEFNESDLPNSFCLFDQRWHQGVVGILASRIKEKYNRPVIAFATVEEAGNSKALPGLSAAFISAMRLMLWPPKIRGLSLNLGAMPWPPVLASRLIS